MDMRYVVKQLEATLVFVNRAQEASPNGSDLWKDLCILRAQVDDQLETVKDHKLGYDADGNAR